MFTEEELRGLVFEEMELFISSLRKVSDTAPEHIVEAERNYYRKLFFTPPAAVEAKPDTKAHDALEGLVEQLVAKRNVAREAKDWAESDAIRDMLVSSGIKIEDSPSGTKWSIK